jgi:hypothetical protein
MRVPIGVGIGTALLRERLTSTAVLGLICIIARAADDHSAP